MKLKVTIVMYRLEMKLNTTHQKIKILNKDCTTLVYITHEDIKLLKVAVLKPFNRQQRTSLNNVPVNERLLSYDLVEYHQSLTKRPVSPYSEICKSN